MRNKADWYAEVAHFGLDYEEFDRMRDAGKSDELLEYAKQYDQEDNEILGIRRSPVFHSYGDIVAEDFSHVLARDYISQSYILFRKMSQREFDDMDERTGGQLTAWLHKYGREEDLR